MMGSLIDELQRREAAAREEAEGLRGQIAQLAECLAGVKERLSRLVITRETVDEVLNGSGAGAPAAVMPDGRRRRGPVTCLRSGCWRCRRGGRAWKPLRCRRPTGTCWRWQRMPAARCGRGRSPPRPG